MYGAALGLAGTAILVAAGARLFDISSPQDLRDRAAADGPPLAEALRGWLTPVKTGIQVIRGYDEPSFPEGCNNSPHLAQIAHDASSYRENSLLERPQRTPFCVCKDYLAHPNL